MEKRLVLWFVLSAAMLWGLLLLRDRLFPPAKNRVPPAPAVVDAAKPKWDEIGRTISAFVAAAPTSGQWYFPNDGSTAAAQEKAIAARDQADKLKDLLQVPEEDIPLGDPVKSPLSVVLSKRGAAVRSITLRKYREADPKTALPIDKPMTLVTDNDDGLLLQIPELDRLKRQSYRLHVGGEPLKWTVKEQTTEQVAFAAEIHGTNTKVIRTFRLPPDQYHIDMDLKFELVNPQQPGVAFAYELTGPQGIPAEGEYWKSMSYRQVVIGAVDAKYPATLKRTLIEPYALDPKRETKVPPYLLSDEARPQELQYAGVMNQFFASLAVLDIGKSEPAQTRYIAEVTPEYAGPDDMDRWTNPRQAGKVSLKMTSREIKVKSGEGITQRYLLYNGPVKVLLLGYEKDVRSGLADHYINDLHLNTLTDYPSDIWISREVFSRIGWTSLLIFCTNLMHTLLEWLHRIVPVYGLTIMLLTFLVRIAMFPISKKQALAMQRQRAMQPELKRLQEKYKDDRQQMAQAQWELFKKYGVNPFSGCLVMLVQMPIFMGLYYALNESVHLRLAGFLWIENLAAPDMLVRWADWPVIGGIAAWLRLGPYFNLLPVISIALLIVQQKVMMPPPSNEQEAVNMKVMNVMMYFMAYMFYWVPSGLCLYFTISSVWGFMERKFLPKMATPAAAEPEAPRNAATPRRPNAPTAGPNRRDGRPSTNGQSDGLLKKLAAWWKHLQEQADKK